MCNRRKLYNHTAPDAYGSNRAIVHSIVRALDIPLRMNSCHNNFSISCSYRNKLSMAWIQCTRYKIQKYFNYRFSSDSRTLVRRRKNELNINKDIMQRAAQSPSPLHAPCWSWAEILVHYIYFLLHLDLCRQTFCAIDFEPIDDDRTLTASHPASQEEAIGRQSRQYYSVKIACTRSRAEHLPMRQHSTHMKDAIYYYLCIYG